MTRGGCILSVSFLLLLASAPPSTQTSVDPELEIRVWEVTRETTKESDFIRIRVEAVNRSSRSLFIEVCCGWKDVPDRFHNPSVEQLSPKGKWIFVGGAYADVPGMLRELKPGELFQSQVFVDHPCGALTVDCRHPEKRRYKLPIQGNHRIKLAYFYSPEDFQASIELPSKKPIHFAVSKTFAILAPSSK